MNATPTHTSPERLAYRVTEFSHAIGIGKTKLFEMMKRKELRTVMIGGRRLIPASEAARLLGTTGGAHEAR